jgi:hypothetical protein
MNKRNLLFIYLLYTSALLIAQPDKTSSVVDSIKIRKVQIMTHSTYSDEEFYINPGIGFKTGRHSIFAGPLFLIGNSYGFTPIGLFAGYTYEPKFRYKKLSTFLLFHIQQGTYYNEVRSIEPQFGYGIKINLFKNLFLNQSFSVGAAYYWRKEIYVGNSYFSGPDLYYLPMVRLGLTYDINVSKK